jgi:hypothetical protein
MSTRLTTPKNFLETISAPARRALVGAGITTLKDLARFSEKELLALHGVGPSALPLLRTALRRAGEGFKKKTLRYK